MAPYLNRREFFKAGGLTLGAGLISAYGAPFGEDEWSSSRLGRVANSQISLYSEPRDDSNILRQFFRDEILRIYYSLTPASGPTWNPVWHRVWGGYVHSANVQLVELHYQPEIVTLREAGQLAEVTTPYADTKRYNRFDGWTPLYRLYYQTTHWATGLDTGPDGTPWYELTDELGDTRFFAPARQLRLIPDEEIAPVSPELAFEAKQIDVELARQTLTAYENGAVVLHTKISTGINSSQLTNGIPTNTPTGQFNISVKMPSKHMGEGRLTDNLEDYELVGVPWTAFFDPRGYAIHGTFWHNNFGTTMSRGCINLPNDAAKWLFRWMSPASPPGNIDTKGFGTTVNIF